MTLFDPAVEREVARAELVAERLEATARSVMAARCRLKQQPGTHGEQAALADELDVVLDRWLEVVGRG